MELEKKSKETTEMAQLLEAEEEAKKKKRQAKEAEEEAEIKKRQAEEAEKKKKEATEAAEKKTRERIEFLEVKTIWLRSKISTQEYTRKCKVDEESNINDDDSDQNVCRPLIASKTTEHFLSVGWP